MRRSLLTLTILIVFVISIFAIGSTVATWDYAGGNSPTPSDTLGFKLGLFIHNEIPKDVEGDKHNDAVNSVVDDNKGLNNPNSKINTSLNQEINAGKDSYSSFDTRNGEDVRTELGLDPDVNFIIEAVDEKTRYLYTTTMEKGYSSSFFFSALENVPVGEYIYPVYRTTLILNATTNKWEEKKVEKGYAKSAYYENPSFLGFTTVETPAFDEKTWVAGTLGTGQANAIYAYDMMNGKAILENATDEQYFKYTNTGRATTKTVTVTEAGADCKVTVLNSNGKKVATRNNTVNGSKEVSFRANKNVTYYLVFTGSTIVSFNID